jgi:hypothetical protein
MVCDLVQVKKGDNERNVLRLSSAKLIPLLTSRTGFGKGSKVGMKIFCHGLAKRF